MFVYRIGEESGLYSNETFKPTVRNLFISTKRRKKFRVGKPEEF
ncbi:unnamed protein product [Larinioides sclopetarius]|uniref:Ribosomal protein S16 n=1 Tax=Larinioides sclopetarius TaxID=280406 RepID=A0AAV2BUY7_9ARAC